MPPKDQVANLELSQQLKKLGYPQESLFYWHLSETKNKRDFDDVFEYNWYVELAGYIDPSCDKEKSISAPTVAELGMALPTLKYNFQTSKHESTGQWFITDYQNTLPSQEADTEADCRAKLLIHLLQNKLIEL